MLSSFNLSKTFKYKIAILFAQFSKIELENSASNSFNIFYICILHRYRNGKLFISVHVNFSINKILKNVKVKCYSMNIVK